MSDSVQAGVVDSQRVDPQGVVVTARMNPWGIAMLVLAGILFLASIIAWVYGDDSANATFDNGTGPTHDQPALYQRVASVSLAGFGLLLVILRVTMEAVRWDLTRR